ncbi:hypothetical protein A2U01_0097374, partial [Trifolium medium]|nr:hypothetical protein [Trifolium medium]
CVMADCVYCTLELDSNTMSTCHLQVKQPISTVTVKLKLCLDDKRKLK